MLFSAVDDRSGVVYDEYRCVYGEDAESALGFLFNAMAPKPEPELPFQGVPTEIYMDKGPGQPLEGAPVRAGQPGRACADPHAAVASRAPHAGALEGKVERSFYTIKRCTRRYTTSTSRRTKRRRTFGCAGPLSPKTTAIIALNRTAGSRTG